MERDPSTRLRRAVKENNLFLVRRLVQRTDMRNPDPGPSRFTSLAWAAVLGCEEVFEFLLESEHDEEELSRDAENNTILILLAGAPTPPIRHGHLARPHSQAQAHLRMARLYLERYAFLLDWPNVQGMTALHQAALKGNEEFVRVRLLGLVASSIKLTPWTGDVVRIATCRCYSIWERTLICLTSRATRRCIMRALGDMFRWYSC
ncbi:hypothetical protein FRC12_019226 [Ceratobasidium sp. 428]|nr:hypothetical protein FRC12_019226 [Ceratobasidium sp. 428]